MRSPYAHLRALTFTSFALAALEAGAAGDARAQGLPAPGFAVDRFDPAERGSSWFVLDSLNFEGDNLRPAIGTTFEYEKRPLAIYRRGGVLSAALVDHMLTAHLGANLTILQRLRVGLNLPIVLYNTGDAGTLSRVFYRAPVDSAGVGDMRFGLDLRLFGTYDSPITMALGGRIFAPTGSSKSYTGDGSAHGGPRLAIAGKGGSFVYGLNFGMHFRGPDAEKFGSIKLGDEFQFAGSAGASFRNGKVVVGPELFGSTLLTSQAFKTRGTPLEVLLGTHFALGSGWGLGLGLGTALVGGYGAPGFRGTLGLEWVMEKELPPDTDGDGILDKDDACRKEKGVKTSDPATNGCPAEGPSDMDGDGIPDSEDACMDVAGKRTNDPRTNGCDDRDHDGIMDSLDACPLEAGPASPDPVKNGCPDRPRGDKDRDGIPDEIDACPEVMGIKTSDPKTSGCPAADSDPDHDGIPSAKDACPDVKGPPDPDPAANGCPTAYLQGGEIKLKKQFAWAPGSVEIPPEKASDDILDTIADLMKNNPTIKVLRIEGHVAAANANAKPLSERRATVIMGALVGRGVDKARLKAVGLGNTKPLAADASSDRMEFHVEGQE